jgi:capsular exopolysaccharide synthesis family protein
MKNLISIHEGKSTVKLEKYPPIISAGKSDPLYLEQVKAFRAKFEYSIDKQKIKVVAVTSSIAGEGKTTSCAQLAINLVMAGRKKVLLIDADMRKSDLSKGFSLPTTPGLSEYLTGKAVLKEIVRTTFLPGLFVIPAGTRVNESSDLLAGDKFRAVLNEFRGPFDVILLDTPPVLPVADTLSLRDQVDGFVFLYRAEFTPHPMMRQAVEEVGEEKIFGVVLNGVASQNQKYYQKYYGKYYHQRGQDASRT